MIDFNAIRAQYPLVEVAARYLPDMKRRGQEYVAKCLWHNDGDPSLSFYRGRDGLFRFQCFPCSMNGDVIDFVAAAENVDVAEAARRITGDDIPRPGVFVRSDPPPDEQDCWDPIVPVPADAPPYNPAQTYNPRSAKTVRYQPVRQDTVMGADGSLLGYVVRLEFDGRKMCPVITYCEGPGGVRRWAAKRFARPTPLVGLDELAARPQAKVLVVSGEKCRQFAADALPLFVCVTWIGGDDGVDHADLDPLKGRELTLFPDADASGIRAMARLAESVS